MSTKRAFTGYKTRRHQLNAFNRQVLKGTRSLATALRDAAMIGAVEERGRTLGILTEVHDLRQAKQRIMALSIMDVLGYGKKGVA